MSDGDDSEAQVIPATPPPFIELPPKRVEPRPFSIAAIIIFSVLALALFAYRNWPYLTREPITRLSYPGSTALWAVHESMLFHDGVNNLPREWQWFAMMLGAGANDVPGFCEETLRDVLQRRDSLVHDFSATPDELRAALIVLLAEQGLRTNAVKELALLSQSDEAVRFRRAFETAYITNNITSRSSKDTPDAHLLSGWTAWRFTTRWLQANRRHDDLARHQVSVAYGERLMVVPWITMFGLAWLVQMVGLIALGVLIFKRPFNQPALATNKVSLWSVREYWGLFTLSFLLGLVVEGLFVHLPIIGQLAWLSHCLFWLMPMIVLLACRHWFRAPETFRQFFGIPTQLASVLWLVAATFALFAIVWLTLIWVPAVVEALGFKSHWSEAYDEIMRYWPWPAKLMHLSDGIIFGPVMEEILFRGLLFGALRTRLSLYPAAIISAVVFGGTHFYSLAGFLSVTVFGFWCALAREKTGSLLPSILAHVLTNFFLFVSLAVMGR